MHTTTISASELRIGNLRQVNGKYVNAVNGATIGHIEMGIIDFIPIELDEKWLLELGFKKGVCYYSFKGFDIDLNGWMGFQNFVFQLPNIKYVHQLQNLFFALTGTELKRKCDE